ncbi:MAG TPA: hypothetical protein VI544_02515 [Candidatus Nanoarchaeia archaeon]|nr:hypothetical protein [Candidatus Nanoarchaeia archaeon]
MREILNKHKSGLIFGTFAALLHAIWSVIVALGFGQGIVNFITALHFFSASEVVQPFVFGNALMLIITAFVVGYALGFIFASVVNFYNKK